MKRTRLIELGIIAIAMILGYNFILATISLLLTVFFVTNNRFYETGSFPWLPSLFYVFLYFISFFLLLVYKRQLAVFINGKEESELKGLHFSMEIILQGAIVILCIITLFKDVPDLLSRFIRSFRSNADNEIGFTRKVDSITIWTMIIRSILVFVLLYFSKKIAVLLSNDVTTDRNTISS